MDRDAIKLLNRMIVQNLCNIPLLNYVTVHALPLLNALSVRVESRPNLAKEAYDFVAVGAFLRVDGNLLADDAGGLVHELLLEVLIHALGLHFEVDELVIWKSALADYLVYDAVRHNQVVPVPLSHC